MDYNAVIVCKMEFAMIKAVFFDLFQTLVRYEPPREELLARALKDFGIEVAPDVLSHPLVSADEYIYREMARRPLSQRTPEEKMAIYRRHQEILLEEAGITAAPEVVMGVLGKMQQQKMTLVLFDDVAPTLDDLKSRGLVLGMVSNIDSDMSAVFERLGLTARLDVIVTSSEAGVSKPDPGIFREALRRAGVRPDEAVFVGDQYQVDIVGARGAGIEGVLLDRTDFYREITDCPRIKSLAELADYLT
jgi:putative hydrolase of the HAD superfamily